jgi:hypothetical protein
MLDVFARIIRPSGVSPKEAWRTCRELRHEHPRGRTLYPILTTMHARLVSKVFLEYTIGIAKRRLTCVVMALLEHKQAAGAWPDSLDVLGDLPRDPFTGQPFVYERRGDGARIHAAFAGQAWEILVEDHLAWSWEE